MDASVMVVVLLAAILHAGWNVMIKSGEDKFLDTVAVATGGALWAMVFLPFLPAPTPTAWPYLVASAAIHVAYFGLVAAAYRAGDMGLTYPIMRGGAPLLVALVGGPMIGEALSPGAWLGVLLICGGVLALALGHRSAVTKPGLGPVGLALLNALVIAAYTIVDGIGSRLAGHAGTYVLWLFALNAPAMLGWAMLARPPGVLLDHARRRWRIGLFGGAASMLTYVLALWAMGHAPVATVAALRETSIVFAALLAVILLGERVGLARALAAGVVALGAISLRLA